MVADVLTVLTRNTNIAETKKNASSVARQVMGVAVLTALKKNIAMEVVATNADGVVLLHLVAGVLIAQQRLMRNKFMDMNH